LKASVGSYVLTMFKQCLTFSPEADQQDYCIQIR